MAQKKIGISRDLIIHPGETIGDVLEERGITQAELATRTGTTSPFISNVIAGKKDISAKFAMALEYALDVPKSFWLNLQANYDAELLETNQLASITDDEREVRDKLKGIVRLLRSQGRMLPKEPKDDSIIALRKCLRISSLCNINKAFESGAFRIASSARVDPYVLGAWIRLCQIACENRTVSTSFDVNKIDLLIAELKDIMVNHEDEIQDRLTKTLSDYGIEFMVVKHVAGAPVQGYISKGADGAYQMFITLRNKFADIFWFSLFHEIGHIVNGDFQKSRDFIDYQVNAACENAANEFAGNALLERESYLAFVDKGDFSIERIKEYARSQNVKPYIVLGRLQKNEEHLKYQQYSSYKTRYEWVK